MSVDVVRDGGVAIVTVNRPDALNALDVEHAEALRDHLEDLAADPEARVVLLTGAGDKAFVAGADIKYMSGLDVDQAKEWGALGHETGRLLETMAKPTIAAINGFALGGGCELAVACDIRYAASSAKLGQPEVNLGIIPGWGGTQLLARLSGLGVAKELNFTGRIIDAEEALRIGLADRLAAADEVRAAAIGFATEIAASAPLALLAIRETMRGDLADRVQTATAREHGEQQRLRATDDFREGVAAVAERRAPNFTGR